MARSSAKQGLQLTRLVAVALTLYQPIDTLPWMITHIIMSVTLCRAEVPGVSGSLPVSFCIPSPGISWGEMTIQLFKNSAPGSPSPPRSRKPLWWNFKKRFFTLRAFRGKVMRKP